MNRFSLCNFVMKVGLLALLTMAVLTPFGAHAAENSLTAFLSEIVRVGPAQTASLGSNPHSRYFRQTRTNVSKITHHVISGGFVTRASFYGGGPKKYEPNSHTANGEYFNQWGLTAAHRTLPFGTRLLVSYGGRSVVVRVNDRGPAVWTGRALDLSRGAASQLGLIGAGVGTVHVSVLGG